MFAARGTRALEDGSSSSEPVDDADLAAALRAKALRIQGLAALAAVGLTLLSFVFPL